VIQSVAHVMMFVSSVRAAAAWYSSLLNLPATFIDDNFAAIEAASARLCFHLADSKVPAGRAGQVSYWRVDSLNDAMDRFQDAGAVLYRGPLQIASGEGMCQFADPFGNLFGLVGAYSDA
jgi:predicted enzyme related to lactoylglutathione lyase